MIKKLSEQHHDVVWPFLAKEASLNLFILGDIEAFGYDKDFQELWGDFAEDGRLRAVMLRFYDSIIPYAETADFDVAGFADIMKGVPNLTLSGNAEITERFEQVEGLELGKKRTMYFCEHHASSKLEIMEDPAVFIATTDHVADVVQLRRQIEDFDVPLDAEQRLRQVLDTNTGRVYGYRVEDKIVASAGTAAENSQSAMVVAVCTHPDYRKQGYASRVLEKLMADVSAEGKKLCLFYDNKEAGRIYKRLGFKDIGMWNMYR